MDHIKVDLEDFLNQAGLKSALLGLALKKAAGEEMVDKVSPYAFKAGVLWVKVPSPVWASEVMSEKPKIINKINKFLQEKLVTDLKTLVYSVEKLNIREEED